MSLTRKAVLIATAFAGLAGAQTKISGTVTCGKPDVTQAIQVGDAKGHVMVLSQNKCTWSKPVEMEGLQAKDDVGSGLNDVRGATSHDQGYDVTTMSNGDKIYVRNSGTAKMKDNVPESMEGKWNFTGGTGKFKGLKGGGTYKGSGKADGTVTIEVEGEYTIGK